MFDTKLYIPKFKDHYVSRPRLIRKIDHDDRRTVIISAPAGFGKSTLLAEWSAQAKREVVWLSLDERDNDPVVFFTCLIASLQTVDDRIGEKAAEAIKLSKLPPIRTLFDTVLSDILKYSAPGALILDDFHLVSNEEITDVFCDFITDLTSQFRVIISSRTNPSFHCARLEMQEKLILINEMDLRFTKREIKEYFKQNCGIELTLQEQNVLHDKTEGWIIPLQMMAIAIKDGDSKEILSSSFVKYGSRMDDYLVEEVLETQSSDLQDFLIKTSLLNQFSAPLCEVLTGVEDGQEMIDRLVEHKLFTIAMDKHNNWYRYHHLFRDLLRERLESQSQGPFIELHQKASAWFEGEEMWLEAIHHAILGEDFKRAVHLIEYISDRYWEQGDLSLLLKYIQMLPEEMIRNQPDIRLFLTWMLYVGGHVQEARQKLGAIESWLGGEVRQGEYSTVEESFLLGKLFAIKSAILCTVPRPRKAIKSVAGALRMLPEEARMWRGIARNAQGVAYRSLDMGLEAIGAFNSALNYHETTGNKYGLIVGLSALAELYWDQGRLADVYYVCQRALKTIQDSDPRFLPMGLIYSDLGKVYLEWGEFEKAKDFLGRSIEVFTEDQEYVCLVDAYFHMARIQQIQGDHESALSLINLAGSIINSVNPPLLLTIRIRAYLAWIRMMGGEIDQAAILLSGVRIRELDRGRYKQAVNDVNDGRTSAYVVAKNPRAFPLYFNRLTRANFLYATANPSEGLAILDELLQNHGQRNSNPRFLEALVLRALCHRKLENGEEAHQDLRRALSLSCPHGHLSTYLQFGPQLQSLIKEVLTRKKEERNAKMGDLKSANLMAYLHKLIAVFRVYLEIPGGFENEIRIHESVEPLTQRENDVLQLLAKGMTYQEIGEKLSVTENTVRTHIKGIYGKLSVNNRVQAVMRAGELNMIPITS